MNNSSMGTENPVQFIPHSSTKLDDGRVVLRFVGGAESAPLAPSLLMALATPGGEFNQPNADREPENGIRPDPAKRAAAEFLHGSIEDMNAAVNLLSMSLSQIAPGTNCGEHEHRMTRYALNVVMDELSELHMTSKRAFEELGHDPTQDVA